MRPSSWSTSMACNLGAFPCKYLGLPLAIKRLTKSDLQPIIDRIADALSGWKVALLALILVKAVLMAIPIHMLIALNVPKWFIKAIDKIRRGFLWRGCTEAKGGNCPVRWERVIRPIQFGQLGVHNLEKKEWTLRMRWLWLQKIDPSRPWSFLHI